MTPPQNTHLIENYFNLIDYHLEALQGLLERSRREIRFNHQSYLYNSSLWNSWNEPPYPSQRTYLRPTRSYFPNSIFNLPRTNNIENNENTSSTRRLTYLDIYNNTTMCYFSELTNPVNTVCPISQIDFYDDDYVLKINYCGHIFSPEQILTWLQNNPTCPMCRCHIIPNDNQQDTNNDTADDNNNNNYNQENNSNLNNETNTLPPINPQVDQAIPSRTAALVNRISSLISSDIADQLADTEPDASGNVNLEFAIVTPRNMQT